MQICNAVFIIDMFLKMQFKVFFFYPSNKNFSGIQQNNCQILNMHISTYSSENRKNRSLKTQFEFFFLLNAEQLNCIELKINRGQIYLIKTY